MLSVINGHLLGFETCKRTVNLVRKKLFTTFVLFGRQPLSAKVARFPAILLNIVAARVKRVLKFRDFFEKFWKVSAGPKP